MSIDMWINNKIILIELNILLVGQLANGNRNVAYYMTTDLGPVQR